VLVVAVVFLVALTMDLARPPERQLSARALVMGVRAYQHIGHQLVPRGQCRFSPTCSSYAEVVIRERGALKGGWLTVRRLIKCGPWTPEGTKDPPPPVGSKSETP
jgi:putative membrane protein insertion efficiency factor